MAADVVSLTAFAGNADFLSIAKQGWLYMDILVAGIGNNAFEAIHLPEVPGYDFGNFPGLLLSGLAMEFVLIVIEEGVQCALTGNNQIVALPFVTVSGFVCLLGGIEPFLNGGGVLCYDTEFAARRPTRSLTGITLPVMVS